MAFASYTGVIQAPASTGQVTYSVPSFGVEPKLIILRANGLTSNGGGFDALMGIGAATSSSNQAAVYVRSSHNANTTSAGRGVRDDRCLVVRNANHTERLVASLVSFALDGNDAKFTLDWSVTSENNHVQFDLFGGDDFEAHVKYLYAAGNGSENIPHGLTDAPSAVFAFSAPNNVIEGNNPSHLILSVGVSDGTTTRSVAAASRNVQATSQTLHEWSSSRLLNYAYPTGNQGNCELSGWDGTNATVVWSDLVQLWSGIFVFMRGVQAHVGETTIPAAGNLTISGCPFQPAYGMFLSPCGEGSGDDARMMIGACGRLSGSVSTVIGVTDQDNQDITNARRFTLNDHCIAYRDHSDSLVFSGALDEFTSDGAVIAMDQNPEDEVDYALAYLLLGPEDDEPEPEPPVITAPAEVEVHTNEPFVFDGANTISIADPDADSDPLTVTLSVDYGVLKLASQSGITVVAGADESPYIQFSGLLDDVNAALDGLVYEPATDYKGADALAIYVEDADELSDSELIEITVDDPKPIANGVIVGRGASLTGAVSVPVPSEVKFAVVELSTPDGLTTETTHDVLNFGVVPKYIRFIVTGAQATGASDNAILCVGDAVGTTSKAATNLRANDGADTTAENRDDSTDWAIHIRNQTGAVVTRATVKAMWLDEDGETGKFTIAWDRSTVTGYKVLALVFGGDNLEVEIIHAQTPATATLQSVEHHLSGAPDFLNVVAPGVPAASSSANNFILSLSFSDLVSTRCVAIGSRHNVGTSMATRSWSARLIDVFSPGQPAQTATAYLDGADSDYIDIAWEAVPTTSQKFRIIAMRGLKAKVGISTLPGAPDELSIDSLGFDPVALLTLSPCSSETNPADPDARLMLGASDGTTDRAVGVFLQDNQDISNTFSWFDESVVSLYDATATQVANATVDAFGEEAVALDVDTTDDEYDIAYVAIGSGVGSKQLHFAYATLRAKSAILTAVAEMIAPQFEASGVLEAASAALEGIVKSNNAPAILAPISVRTPVNTAVAFESPNQISIVDPDAFDTTLTVSLSVEHGTIKLGSTSDITIEDGADESSEVVISGKLDALNAALDGLEYTPDTDFMGNDKLSIVVDDGFDGIGFREVIIRVGTSSTRSTAGMSRATVRAMARAVVRSVMGAM